MSIGEAIKAEIERPGLTAYRVAKMAGIKPDVVSRFLLGERGVELLPHRPDLALVPRARPGRTRGRRRRASAGGRTGARFRCCASRAVSWGWISHYQNCPRPAAVTRRWRESTGHVVSRRWSGRIIPDALA